MYTYAWRKYKKHREIQGLTQTALGSKVCSSAAAVSSWERGKKIPDIETIIELANVFDISLDELILGRNYRIQRLFREVENMEQLERMKFILHFCSREVQVCKDVELIMEENNENCSIISKSDTAFMIYICDSNKKIDKEKVGRDIGVKLFDKEGMVILNQFLESGVQIILEDDIANIDVYENVKAKLIDLENRGVLKKVDTSVGVGYQADNIWMIKAILILLSNVLC